MSDLREERTLPVPKVFEHITKSNELHMKIFVLKKGNQTCVVVAATTDAAIARVKQRTGDIYAVTGVAKLNEVLINP